jgi:hypothetical protein
MVFPLPLCYIHKLLVVLRPERCLAVVEMFHALWLIFLKKSIKVLLKYFIDIENYFLCNHFNTRTKFTNESEKCLPQSLEHKN